MELTVETFTRFRDLIYEKTGIYYPENKKYVLDSRLLSRLAERNCSTYEEYLSLLKTDAWRDRELPALFNVVTTNETYFFRDQPQLQAFSDLILPAVLKENRETKRVRVWSAACSTGDEPYTLAIMLLEKGLREGARPGAPGAGGCEPEWAGWSAEIAASDISEAALASARRGAYGAYAMRQVPPSLAGRYFTPEDGQQVVKPDVKRLVRFANVNLFDAARVKLMKGMDVIFCRNCLIYFDEKAKKRVVDVFYDCLNPRGFLVIGFSESLHNLTRAFRPVPANKTVIYQKA